MFAQHLNNNIWKYNKIILFLYNISSWFLALLFCSNYESNLILFIFSQFINKILIIKSRTHDNTKCNKSKWSRCIQSRGVLCIIALQRTTDSAYLECSSLGPCNQTLGLRSVSVHTDRHFETTLFVCIITRSAKAAITVCRPNAMHASRGCRLCTNNHQHNNKMSYIVYWLAGCCCLST